jgi:hypothetical protein
MIVGRTCSISSLQSIFKEFVQPRLAFGFPKSFPLAGSDAKDWQPTPMSPFQEKNILAKLCFCWFSSEPNFHAIFMRRVPGSQLHAQLCLCAITLAGNIPHAWRCRRDSGTALP